MTEDRQDASAPAGGGPSLVALVVTYNRLDHIEKTVARLRAEGVSRLVVVDNASADGTRDWLATQEGDGLEALLLPHNRGGAGGFAAGLAHVRATLDPDWVLLCDDDARPAPGAIAAFRAAAAREACDGIVAAVFLGDGAVSDMNRPLRNPFRRGRKGAWRLSDADYAPDAGACEVDMATYVGLFLSRRALAAETGPDPRLFIYGDDLLHTLRLSQAGMRLVFAPSVRFEHECETLGPAHRYRPVWKVYYHYRNAILLYRQAAGRLFWPVMLLRLPKWWRAARHYGEDAGAFRRLLRAAVADGIAGRLDAPPEGIPRPPDAAVQAEAKRSA